MPQTQIIITREDLRCLATVPAQELMQFLGQPSKQRLSHIEPTNAVKRWAFHRLRRLFGDEGRVSDWTRRWRCQWRVNFAPTNGDIYDRDDQGRPFLDRSSAVAFEERQALHYLRRLTHC